MTTTASGPLLAVRDLDVGYGSKGLALRGVSLSVPRGRIVALLGPNGAGKTTTIRAISGLLSLHGGKIVGGAVSFDGRDLGNLQADRIVRLGVGQVPEGRLVFKNLTVEENLQVGASTVSRAEGARNMEAVYGLFPRLAERKGQAAGLMSGGEQQMLALGRALASGPRLLLIDELSLGLAPLIVRAIYDQLAVIRTKLGTAILVVEQNARLALSVCDEAYVLDRGTIAISGPAQEVSASARVHEAYLGAGAAP